MPAVGLLVRLNRVIVFCLATCGLIIGPVSNVRAQEVGSPAEPGRERRMTVTGGVGNAHGWFGGQVQRHFGANRWGVFGGLGYTPDLEPHDPSGLTVAAGIRVFTGGPRHRGYLELSVSQIGIEAPGGVYPDGRRLYGPGFQGGYEYSTPQGVTFVASLGIGRAIGLGGHDSPWQPMVGLGIGYTWSRNRR